jgi:glycosyltransferase involved in cell wall biosynthesis
MRWRPICPVAPISRQRLGVTGQAAARVPAQLAMTGKPGGADLRCETIESAYCPDARDRRDSRVPPLTLLYERHPASRVCAPSAVLVGMLHPNQGPRVAREVKRSVMPPALSVIICSLNGAEGLGRCLRALESQTIRPALELIVVDDGSTDSTSDVARAHGVHLVRHGECRGLAAARNSGVRVASAPIVAFLDDDCEPDVDWSEKLIAAFPDDILALGGSLNVPDTSGIVLSYLHRNNPLAPRELDLAKSHKLMYRLWRYLVRQWSKDQHHGRRAVFSFAGGNMALRRSMLAAVGGFDERIRFGGEEDDVLWRLERAFPGYPVVYDPSVRVLHHFEPSLGDTLRRSRAYGRGHAMLCRKWRNLNAVVFPFPLMVFALLVSAIAFPYLAIAAALLPELLYPRGLRSAVRQGNALCLFDAYIQLAQETAANFGFVQGWFRYRDVAPEIMSLPARTPVSR